jgi:UDP-N-acetylmuramate--alanine ligase
MADIDLGKVKRVHMIGIGGIGMSALARFFLHEKMTVSGSDRVLTPITKKLDEAGVQVFGEQNSGNVSKDVDLVVYTEAVSKGSEGWAELQQARAYGIPSVNYFEALGLAVNPYYLIAVSGTHGKTTTTAMATDIFEAATKDPTAIIGSLRAKTGSNYRAGKTKYAIVEACEYKRDFLHLEPDVLVITNLEHEHADYYQDLAATQAAFSELVTKVREGGVIIANPADPNVAPVLEHAAVPVIDYMKHVDPQLKLKQPGMHNRLNAAAALAAAMHEKLDRDTAEGALEQFAGTWRRFEYKGECNGAAVYDDYGHHPTEIKATIAGTRELYPDRRMIIIFEPHTYSRTAALFSDFAKAFKGADEVILLPIYAARNEDPHGVTSRELAVKALEHNSRVSFIKDYDEVIMQLHPNLTEHDVVVVMGAGPVTELASKLVQK